MEQVLPQSKGWTLGFRDICRPTDIRTMIASLVPWAGYGNKLPLLIGKNYSLTAQLAARLVSNLNSLVTDFVVRQKMQSANMNWYILEQIAVISRTNYHQQFGATTAHALILDHVLRLTYTSHDMAPFARDLGYDGSPFTWDEEERRHLRSRL